MALYKNILLSKKNDEQSKVDTELLRGSIKSSSDNKTPNMKLVPHHLLNKKRSQPQQSTNQPGKVQKQEHHKHNDQVIISESNLHTQWSENDWNPEDEYDPMMPNSYELLQAEYLRLEEQKLLERKSSSSANGAQSKPKLIPNLLEVLDELEDDEILLPSEGGGSSCIKNLYGTAIAPPPSLKATTTSDNIVGPKKPTTTTTNYLSEQPATKLDGCSVAAKIMSKMGYKVGKGLGKDEQGISRAIEVEKSGLNSGRIVIQPTTALLAAAKAPSEKAAGESDGQQAPTRVLLLQNMVGPGEVDDDLEAETKEECKKYGDVIKCLIYEIPNKKVADDEAVRIFVEFKNVDSTMRAISDLNGRYFGGRIVRASFYNLERFQRYELGPAIGKAAAAGAAKQ